MSSRSFLRILIYACLAGMLLYSALCFLLPLYKYIYLSLATMILFSAMSVLIWIMGARAIQNSRSGAFLSIMVMSTFLKLIGSFVFVFAYVKIWEPDDKLFAIPFMIYYLAFTVAETHVLMTQARKSKIT